MSAADLQAFRVLKGLLFGYLGGWGQLSRSPTPQERGFGSPPPEGHRELSKSCRGFDSSQNSGPHIPKIAINTGSAILGSLHDGSSDFGPL